MFQLLLAIIYLAFISLGLPDSLLGSAWPAMYQELAVPVSYAGIISMIIAVGTIISSLHSDRLTRRFGTGRVTAFSVLMTAAALFGFSISRSYVMLCLWAIPYGLGAGSVDASLNNYVALHYKARAMNFLHAFWGVGTLVGPFLLSYFFAHGMSWRNGYISIGSIQSVILVIILLSGKLWSKAGESNITEDGKKPEIRKQKEKLSDAIKQPGAVAAMLGFFSYCSMEQSSMLWASTFLVSARGFSESSAAASAGLLFWGITAGRIVSGLIADRINEEKLIRISQCSILISVFLVLFTPPSLSPIALFLLGMGFGPMYPTMLHQTPEYFGHQFSARIMGLEMSSAYIGSAFMPALFGVIGRSISMTIFPIYVLALLFLNIIVIEIKRRRTKNHK